MGVGPTQTMKVYKTEDPATNSLEMLRQVKMYYDP